MLGAVFESGLNAMEMGRAVWSLRAFESDVSGLHFFLLKVSLSVYLLVFGYLYKEDEVGVGCWLSYQFCVAVLCSNAVVQGHMVSVVERSQAFTSQRFMQSIHIQLQAASLQPVLSLCHERPRLYCYSRASMSSVVVNKPCWLPLYTREVGRQQQRIVYA